MFGRNLKFLRNKYGLEQMDLAEKLGRKSSSTISEWEKGKYTPKLSTLNEISKIFNVEIDDLMNIDLSLQTSKVNNDINIIYNKLNSDRQQKVYSFAETQLEEQNNKVVPLVGQTAANPEVLTYGDPTHEETCLASSRNADYGILVNGDSMEPDYKDGSFVSYREQPTVENGELAIVEIDGEGVTFKKFYYFPEENKVVLRSLNDKYKDRELEANRVRIVGKVL